MATATSLDGDERRIASTVVTADSIDGDERRIASTVATAESLDGGDGGEPRQWRASTCQTPYKNGFEGSY